jgi:hypothetical protein
MQTFRRTLAALALAATAGTTVATAAMPADARIPVRRVTCVQTGVTLKASSVNTVSGTCFTPGGWVWVDFEDTHGAWFGQYVKAGRTGKIGPVSAPGWCIDYIASSAQDVTTNAYVQIPVTMLSTCAY